MVEAERDFNFFRIRALKSNKIDCPLDYPAVQQVSLESCKNCSYHIKMEEDNIYCGLYWL